MESIPVSVSVLIPGEGHEKLIGSPRRHTAFAQCLSNVRPLFLSPFSSLSPCPLPLTETPCSREQKAALHPLSETAKSILLLRL